jgi:peptidoglycan-N-acetylglucosamine deacetylase
MPRRCGATLTANQFGICMIGLAAGLLIIAGCGAVIIYACVAPASEIFRPVLVRGPAESRNVVLTFDDGPTSPFTEQILDILAEHQVPATFFLCGKNVERHPEIARRIVREGHSVGNHTFSHPLLLLRSRKFMAGEIDRTQETIERVTGVRPNLFRPPYGARWFGLMPTLKARGLEMVMWSAAGYDWKYRTQAIIKATTREMRSGSVLLLHDGHERQVPGKVDQSSTVEALPAILDAAAEAGLRVVPITEFASPTGG